MYSSRTIVVDREVGATRPAQSAETDWGWESINMKLSSARYFPLAKVSALFLKGA